MEKEIPVLQGVVLQQEIRGVIHHFPSGPIEGYEWRLLVNHPETSSSAAGIEWTKWVFGSHQAVEQMLAQWQTYMATEGHLAGKAPTGSMLQ